MGGGISDCAFCDVCVGKSAVWGPKGRVWGSKSRKTALKSRFGLKTMQFFRAEGAVGEKREFGRLGEASLPFDRDLWLG